MSNSSYLVLRFSGHHQVGRVGWWRWVRHGGNRGTPSINQSINRGFVRAYVFQRLCMLTYWVNDSKRLPSGKTGAERTMASAVDWVCICGLP